MSSLRTLRGLVLSTEALDETSDTPSLPLPVSDMDSLRSNTSYTFSGLTIFVEHVKGDVRSGRDASGNPWSKTMPTAYGYVEGTTDADSEEVDVYVNQNDFDPSAPVYVMDQIDPQTGRFDKHKCFIGYASSDDALRDYGALLPNSSQRVGCVVSMPLPDFVTWVKSDAPKVPLDQQKSGSSILKSLADTKLIKIPLTDKAPKITVTKKPNGVSVEIYILTEFSASDWGASLETILDILTQAESNDIVLISISSYGGELDVAARIASAIRVSKAKVTTLSLGPVASAGCLVWCEGHERLISAGSYFMQHEAGCAIRGKSSQIAKMALVTSEYVKSIIFTRAIQVGLFTDSEISEMVDKGVDVFNSAHESAQRTGTELV